MFSRSRIRCLAALACLVTAAFFVEAEAAAALNLGPGQIITVASGNPATVYSFDPSLNPGGPASGFLSVAGDTYTGLAVIGSGLYVSNASRLFSIDTATGARTQIYGSFFGPYAGLGNNGTNLVVYESNLGVFGEVTTSGVLLDDFQLSTGGAGVDVHGNQIFLAKRSGANAGNVEVYDYTTHALQYVIQTNLGSGTMTGLGYDSANNHLVITAGSEIFRFSTSQFPTLLTHRFGSSFGDGFGGVDVIAGPAIQPPDQSSVPEPTSAILMAMSGLGLACGARFRGRRLAQG